MAKVKDKKTKRIVKANIRFISLCQRGANTFSTIYKAEDGDDKNIDFTTLCKDMNEKGEIIACMYAPEIEDSQGDVASREVIEKFAHDFLKNGEGIDTEHDEAVLSKNDISVVESFIIQKGDERFTDMKNYDGDAVNVVGGWGVVLKVDSEDLREKYRSGDWSGVSMGGTAIKKEDSDGKLLKALKDLLNINKKENKVNKNTENDMALNKEDKAEMVELVTKTITDLKKADDAEAIKKAEELKKSKKDGPKLGLNMTVPVLKADPTAEDRVKHVKCLEIHKLSETVDPTDPRAMYDFEQKATAIAKSKDLNETLNKQATSPYEGFFTSNQNMTEIEKADLVNTDDDGGVAKAIEKSLDESEKKD